MVGQTDISRRTIEQEPPIRVMINPDFRVEIHYSPTPEIPLPLSLSGICPFTNLYTLSFQLLPSGLRRGSASGSGTRKLEIAPPLAFLPLGKPGGLWKLEIALFFTSSVLKLDGGWWATCVY